MQPLFNRKFIFCYLKQLERKYILIKYAIQFNSVCLFFDWLMTSKILTGNEFVPTQGMNLITI